jgi:hypothetical protein
MGTVKRQARLFLPLLVFQVDLPPPLAAARQSYTLLSPQELVLILLPESLKMLTEPLQQDQGLHAIDMPCSSNGECAGEWGHQLMASKDMLYRYRGPSGMPLPT